MGPWESMPSYAGAVEQAGADSGKGTADRRE